MEETEGEIVQIYAKQCGTYTRNTLQPYEYEWWCVACGYNVIKRKHELSKIPRKKLSIDKNTLNIQHNINCISCDTYLIYERQKFDENYKALSILKNNKRKTNNILIEKQKIMFNYLDFEKNYYSRTAEGFYKFGHASNRLMKVMA